MQGHEVKFKNSSLWDAEIYKGNIHFSSQDLENRIIIKKRSMTTDKGGNNVRGILSILSEEI